MESTRRRLLRTGAVTGLAGVAGCLGVLGGDGGDEPDGGTADERPDGVYVQPFVEEMATAGTAEVGDYAFGVMWTTTHRFWTPTQDELSEQPAAGSVHLMSVVWDPETRTVLPESGLSVEIYRDDALVSQEVIYPMLSQRMGFHYGANFELDGDGTYEVRPSVAGTSVRRTGAFEGRFGEPATAAVEMTFTDATREQVSTREIDQGGQPGAVEPMDTPMPRSTVPAVDDLPGRTLGTVSVDGADLGSVFLPPTEAGRFTDGRGYLAVVAATPYNRTVLPAMGIEATLEREGDVVAEGSLERTLDPDLGYHYGLPVDAEAVGDAALTLSVTTPPQVSRHQGYETAFVETGTATVEG
ncbi:fe2+ transport protein [Halobacteriales archaeon SW_5_70_135]|nr:MAG: fe2+ transport protein [Halobacteriales archaeon SW_5_70_135]